MPKTENTTGLPVNIIIDELKSDDIRKRINSVKNLAVIANSIGPMRTKNELIPFIQELLDDEDEVLVELVQSLADDFVDLVGGQHLVLLPTFEALCKVEESTVREKAAQQIKKCLLSVNEQKKQEEIGMGIIKRLNENEYFLCKHAVAIILPSLLTQVSNNNQNELLNIYLRITKDPIPQIRKFGSIYFSEVVKSYPVANDNFIQNVLTSLIKDEQDFIRMYIVDSLIALCKTNYWQRNQNLILGTFKQLAEDQSWRVRYYFSDKLPEIGEAAGKDGYRKHFQAYHLKFIQDPEPEMKANAALQIEKVVGMMDPEDINNKLIPLLKQLQPDQNGFVRNALASSLLSLCPIIGKKVTTEQILPIFLSLLKDNDSDVRITLFKKLSLITNILGVDALSQSVIPALTELAQDKNWRIRVSTIEVLSFFAKAIGSEFLNDKVLKLLLDWLGDKVFSVRQSAIQQTAQLIQILGVQWAERNLLSKIWQLLSIQNYLHRLTVVFTITQISPQMSNDYLIKTIIPLLQQASKDSVANVRSSVCKSIANIVSKKDKTGALQDPLRKILSSLLDDPDQEVKYQAKTALESF